MDYDPLVLENQPNQPQTNDIQRWRCGKPMASRSENDLEISWPQGI